MRPSSLLVLCLLNSPSVLAGDPLIPPPVNPLPQTAQAHVAVSRPEDLAANACDIGLYVQDLWVATLTPGKQVTVEVPVGDIALSVAPVGSAYCTPPGLQVRNQSAVLQAGETRRYEVATDEGGLFLAPEVE
ncbi:MAG: hypothetical protein V4812_01840 [Pseudomonadota bacterium]